MKINVGYEALLGTNKTGIQVTLTLPKENKGLLVNNEIFIDRDSDEYRVPKSFVDIQYNSDEKHTSVLLSYHGTPAIANAYVKDIMDAVRGDYSKYLERRQQVVPDDEVIDIPDDLTILKIKLNH